MKGNERDRLKGPPSPTPKNVSDSTPHASEWDYIPKSTATVERTFSALKRIKTYVRNTTGQSGLAGPHG